ncbi:MAG: hypothetical protein HYS07_06325 [Chlamydiae bacterium]|nr:hypothetical protein [Chlamydiota bacterium]MBI3277342.1 hypothetical protein [Chlamydiota bacterium]
MKIFALFFLLSLLYAFPQWAHIFTHIFGLSTWSGDTLGTLHDFWSKGHLLQLGILNGRNPYVAAPFGLVFEAGVRKLTPLSDGLIYLMMSFLNEILAYNLFILLGVALSAWAMTVLVEHLTGNRWAGIFSGFIFGFSPNMICQNLSGHIGYAHAEWIPLYVLFLWKFLEAPSLRKGLLTGFFFALIWLSATYLGYFSFFFTLALLAWRFVVFERVNAGTLKKWVGLCGIYGWAFLLMLPALWETASSAVSPSNLSESARIDFIRSWGDLVKYSARLWDYIVPSELNPILGHTAVHLVNVFGGRHLSDRTLYLGGIPCFFALYGLYMGWHRRKILEKEKRFFISSMVFCGLAMVLLSLTPELKLGHFQIPMPSHFLYRFFPMFRYYSRAGFFVSLCVAALAGFGFSEFLKTRKTRVAKIFYSTLAMGLLALEYTVLPPIRNVNVSKTSEVYQWLSRQTGDWIIGEYPIFRDIDERQYQYRSNQRFHGKRLMNGADEKTPEDWMIRSNRDLWQEHVPGQLAALGVKYIVLHKECYAKDIQQKVLNAKGLKLVQDFSDVFLFEVTAPPLDWFWVNANTYLPEREADGQEWSWISGNGMFVFYKRTSAKLNLQIKFKMKSYQIPREVQIHFEGRTWPKFVAQPDQTEEILLDGIQIYQGLHTIFLDVNSGEVRRSDGHKVSIAVSAIQFDEGISAEGKSS